MVAIHAEELINLTSNQFVTLLVAKKAKRHSMIETKKKCQARAAQTVHFHSTWDGIFGTGLELCIVSFDNGMPPVSVQAAVPYLRNTEI
jgi:hypothetical protein